MENEVKNEIMMKGANNIQTDVFGESNVKQITTLDLTNDDHIEMLLNAQQDVDFKLNDCVGQNIEVMGCTIRERELDSFNEETGEQVTRKKHVLMLFDTEGKSYVTGSNACYYSFMAITSLKGLPSEDNIMNLTPVKVDAKEKGHSYLRLKLTGKASN